MRGPLTVAMLLVGAGLLWLMVMWPSKPRPDTAHAPLARSALAGEPAAPQRPPVVQAEHVAPATPQPSAAPSAVQSRPVETHSEAQPDVFSEVRGPLDEFQRRFEREPRASNASDAETTIHTAFEPEQAHGELLRSVLCRTTLCRIELRWSTSKLGNYVAAMGRLSVRFAPELASTAAGPEAGEQDRVVELYVERKP